MSPPIDEDLARLRRALEEAPADALARARWRAACLRAGRPGDAGLEPGDLVAITEEDADDCPIPFPPVIAARGWRAIVVSVGKRHLCALPIDEDVRGELEAVRHRIDEADYHVTVLRDEWTTIELVEVAQVRAGRPGAGSCSPGAS